MPYFGIERADVLLVSLDLNADLGESEDDFVQLIQLVSSANIACGSHAGGGEILRKAVEAAVKNQVQIGAHPSYPDKENFGRVSLRDKISQTELLVTLIEQVDLVLAEASKQGGSLTHIKAHGALYNDAMVHEDTAQTLISLAKHFETPLLGLPGSVIEKLANDEAISFVAEGFVDRAFTTELTLVPRSEPGALLNEEDALKQVRQIAEFGSVTTNTGETVPLDIKTLCVHADTPHAVSTATKVRALLTELGVQVKAFRSN